MIFKLKQIIQIFIIIILISSRSLFAELAIKPVIDNFNIEQKGEHLIITYSLIYDGINELRADIEFSPNNGDQWYALRGKYDQVIGNIGIVEPARSNDWLEAEWERLTENGNPPDEVAKQEQIKLNNEKKQKEIRWHISSSLYGIYTENARFAVIVRNRYEGVPGRPDLIIDHKTSFIWTANTNPFLKKNNIYDDGLRDYNAVSEYLNSMNNGEVDNFGFSDWRFPTNDELGTLPFSTDKNAHPFFDLKNSSSYFTTTDHSGTRQIVFVRGPHW